MNQHHFLTTYIWDALNVNASQMKSFLREKEKCSLISAGAFEKITRMGKTCPTTWKGMLKSAWNEIANWRTQKTQQLYKVSTLCLDGRPIRKEELESVGEFSEVCSQIVLHCLYPVRNGRPHIPWSVNKLARSVTKRTQACD